MAKVRITVEGSVVLVSGTHVLELGVPMECTAGLTPVDSEHAEFEFKFADGITVTCQRRHIL